MNLKKLYALRQNASEFAGEWQAEEKKIIDLQGDEVGRVGTPKLAAYICMIHNSWLVLTNQILLLHRALADRKALTKLEDKEKL